MLQANLFAPRPPWVAGALELLARHRFLTARQLAAALGRAEPEVAPVAEALVGEGVLQTLAPTTLSLAKPGSRAFALTRAGLACIAAEGNPSPSRMVRPLTSSFTLAHELLVNELALVVRLLDARGALRLLLWETRRERIADVTHLAERGRAVRVPLVADALLVVEHQGQRQGLLIEIDMATVSAKSMRRKFAGYHAWWSEGGPARRFGLTASRVLTVAPAVKRLERLRALSIEAVDARGSGLFWFLPHEAVDVVAPERLLAAVARVGKAGDESPRPLFPP
ncbi:MAG: replication-relaxation family protein [Deltaproteobacteria bacterium]|nr:replication-relaxation family protein [Deltaproteobacteria bacterium]